MSGREIRYRMCRISRGGQVGMDGCLVRGSRGRSPSPVPVSSCRGGQVGMGGCLVRGSRGRSPSRRRMPRAGVGRLAWAVASYAARGDARPPGDGCLVPGWAGWHGRLPRTRLAGTLAFPGDGCLVPEWASWRGRMPRTRLAGTLALPETDASCQRWCRLA